MTTKRYHGIPYWQAHAVTPKPRTSWEPVTIWGEDCDLLCFFSCITQQFAGHWQVIASCSFLWLSSLWSGKLINYVLRLPGGVYMYYASKPGGSVQIKATIATAPHRGIHPNMALTWTQVAQITIRLDHHSVIRLMVWTYVSYLYHHMCYCQYVLSRIIHPNWLIQFRCVEHQAM